MSELTIAATQMACSIEHEKNINKAELLIREAASQGANLVLLQELFSSLYFCKDQNYLWFVQACSSQHHPLLDRMSELAKELNVVLPVSFFEKSGNVFFNSVAIMDADGS